jgi:RED-like protein N-terminal region
VTAVWPSPQALFQPVQANPAEAFLPGRTAFVYDLSDATPQGDVPTLLRCGRVHEVVCRGH